MEPQLGNAGVSGSALPHGDGEPSALLVRVGCLLGIALPVCECGMIPVVRRLIHKGMPVYLGVAYLLAAPGINPVTYAATAMAFQAEPRMAHFRIGLAFAVAAAASLARLSPSTIMDNRLSRPIDNATRSQALPPPAGFTMAAYPCCMLHDPLSCFLGLFSISRPPLCRRRTSLRSPYRRRGPASAH